MFGIGIDICEVSRFDRLKKEESFLKRVFTEREIEICSRRKNDSECFAARFAAKEAFLKALGTGLRTGTNLIEIEVSKDELGKPFLELSGTTKETFNKSKGNFIHLSISHEKTLAVAVVVII